jgi:hypothetical protein
MATTVDHQGFFHVTKIIKLLLQIMILQLSLHFQSGE